MVPLWRRNPMPCSFPLKKPLCPSSVVVSPKFFHLISQSPRMFHLYLSISCVSSWSFPTALSVLRLLVFHVPYDVVSSTNLWWCTSNILYTFILVCSGKHGMVLAKYNLTEPIPLQVDHVAVEFIVQPFCPSGPFLLTMIVWRYPPSDAVLTPAILPITGRLVEGGSIWFLPVQVQRTCPLPAVVQ